jgi:hypothetical protein
MIFVATLRNMAFSTAEKERKRERERERERLQMPIIECSTTNSRHAARY